VKLVVGTLIALSMPVALMALWAFRSRMAVLRARLGTAVKLLALLYAVTIAYHLANSEIDQQQLQTAALSLAFFGCVWLVAWLITRSMAGNG